MRFVFLGTGTSSGVPAIGCTCAVCTSADPRDRRTRTAACVRFTDAGGQERVVLLDAGPDLRQQALREGLRRCDAIMLTHAHVDHAFGLDEVRRFNAVMRAPIDLYAEAPTHAFVRRVYAHIFDRRQNVNDSFVATLIPRPLQPGLPIDLWGVRITPFRMLHGRMPVLAFRVERAPGAGVREEEGTRDTPPLLPLAYCTDVSGIPPESWVMLRGLGTLVLDALRHRHHPTHLTLSQAASIAERVGAPRTYFVHMAHDLPHAETDASLPPGMHLAYDGLVLD
jgi:phosphoribosyl 1,2-cyclic phosphate phosphodiesterase